MLWSTIKDFGPGTGLWAMDHEVSLSRKGARKGRNGRTGGGEGSFHHIEDAGARRPQAVGGIGLDGKARGSRARARRGTGAAGRNRGGLAGHRQLARRFATGVRDHAGARDPHLRGQVRPAGPIRGRCLSRGGAARRAAGACRGAPAQPHTSSRAAHRTRTRRGHQAHDSDRRRPSRARLFRSHGRLRCPADRHARRCADVGRRPHAQAERAHGGLRHLSPGGAAVHRPADRADHQLRSPGRHRDREHAPAQRAAPAHRRPLRGTGAADCYVRGVARHLELARRAAGRVRGHAGECGSRLRRQVRCLVARRRRWIPVSGAAWRAAGICRSQAKATLGMDQSRNHVGPRSSDQAGGSSRPTSARTRPTSTIQAGLPSWSLPARAPCSMCRCSRTTSSSARSAFTVRRCGLSPTSRSSWSAISPNRP